MAVLKGFASTGYHPITYDVTPSQLDYVGAVLGQVRASDQWQEFRITKLTTDCGRYVGSVRWKKVLWHKHAATWFKPYNQTKFVFLPEGTVPSLPIVVGHPLSSFHHDLLQEQEPEWGHLAPNTTVDINILLKCDPPEERELLFLYPYTQQIFAQPGERAYSEHLKMKSLASSYARELSGVAELSAQEQKTHEELYYAFLSGFDPKRLAEAYGKDAMTKLEEFYEREARLAHKAYFAVSHEEFGDRSKELSGRVLRWLDDLHQRAQVFLKQRMITKKREDKSTLEKGLNMSAYETAGELKFVCLLEGMIKTL